MAGGYILPNGEFQEDTSSVTETAPLPADSVCGAAVPEPQPTEVTE